MLAVVAVWEDAGRSRFRIAAAAIGTLLLVLDRCVIPPPRAALPAPADWGTGGEMLLRLPICPLRHLIRNKMAMRIKMRPAHPPTIPPTRTLVGGAPLPLSEPGSVVVVDSGGPLWVGDTPTTAPPVPVFEDSDALDEVVEA